MRVTTPPSQAQFFQMSWPSQNQLDLIPLNFQLLLRPLPVPFHPLLLRIQHELVPLLHALPHQKMPVHVDEFFVAAASREARAFSHLFSMTWRLSFGTVALPLSTTISSSSSSNPIDWWELEPSFLFLPDLRSATSWFHFSLPLNMTQQWLKANGFFSTS